MNGCNSPTLMTRASAIRRPVVLAVVVCVRLVIPFVVERQGVSG
jgi:hypothetical protein